MDRAPAPPFSRILSVSPFSRFPPSVLLLSVCLILPAACAHPPAAPLPPSPFAPFIAAGAQPPVVVHLGRDADTWTATPEQAVDTGFDPIEFNSFLARRGAGTATMRVASGRGVLSVITIRNTPFAGGRVLRLALRNDTDRVIAAVDFPRLGPLQPVPGGVLAVPYIAGWAYDAPVAAAAERPIAIAYPVPASMPWLDYHTPAGGLYLGVDDPALDYKILSFGGPERLLGVRFFPFIPPGGEWTSPPVTVALHGGDWHAGADIYRAGFEVWGKPQTESKVQGPTSNGWIWLTIRNEKGEPACEGGYGAIPRRAVETLPNGIDTVQLAGWFYNGHDTDYPDYRPIDELGGWEALRAAVMAVHGLGGRVFFYFNGRIANLSNATYGRHRWEWEVLGPDGAPAIETYADSRFAVLCPSVREWREHLVGQVVRLARETKADGAFIDQVAAAPALLCYNRAHGHATPASAFGPGYLALMRELREATRAVRPDFFVWVEGTHDAYGRHFDAHQTGCEGAWFKFDFPGGRPLPELTRYALPWQRQVCACPRIAERGAEPLAHGFLLGKALIWNGPETKPLTEMYARAPGCFYAGTLLDERWLEVSDPAVTARLLAGAEGLAVTLWNRAPERREVEVRCRFAAGGAAPGAAVEVVDLGNSSLPPVESRLEGGAVRFRVRLEAGEARAWLVRRAEERPQPPPSPR